jgi:hypothetical protein
LHRKAVLIGRFPFGKEGAVVKPKAGWLFRHVDVECGAGKESGGDECDLSCEHAFPSFDSSVARFTREILGPSPKERLPFTIATLSSQDRASTFRAKRQSPPSWKQAAQSVGGGRRGKPAGMIP